MTRQPPPEPTRSLSVAQAALVLLAATGLGLTVPVWVLQRIYAFSLLAPFAQDWWNALLTPVFFLLIPWALVFGLHLILRRLSPLAGTVWVGVVACLGTTAALMFGLVWAFGPRGWITAATTFGLIILIVAGVRHPRPFFGLLAKLQRSVFIDRRPNRAGAQRDEMVARLESGDSLILFPEGTSGDGNRVLPFKSALFAVAGLRPHGKPLVVQPVSIAYTRLDGMPIGRYLRPYFAWYGDMDLLGHLWRALGLGHLTVAVEFHPPVTLEDFASRKALAGHCQRAVADGLATALSGRPRRRPAKVAAPEAMAPDAAAPEETGKETGQAPANKT